MKLDDAEYYYLNFSDDALSPDNGATHIGMFYCWQVLSRGTELFLDADAIKSLESREITPGAFMMQRWDGKFSADYLSEHAQAFAVPYYKSAYLEDYAKLFGVSADDVDAFCSVPDTWETYDRVEPMLDDRFMHWVMHHQRAAK